MGVIRGQISLTARDKRNTSQGYYLFIVVHRRTSRLSRLAVTSIQQPDKGKTSLFTFTKPNLLFGMYIKQNVLNAA